MKVSFAKTASRKAGALVLFALEGQGVPKAALALAGKAKAALAKAIATHAFTGKTGQTLEVPGPAGKGFSRIRVVGAGKADVLDRHRAEEAAAHAAAHLLRSGETEATLAPGGIKGKHLTAAEFAARAAAGFKIRAYHFSKYRTKQPEREKAKLARATVVTQEGKAAAIYARLEKAVDAIYFTRDLVTEPANVIYPASFAKEIVKLKKLGVKVEVLRAAQLKKLGMNALLGVGQGSAKESLVVVMHWRGSRKKNTAPVAFIGKGVTFDTGGISLKPSEGMDEMKWDMGGAAIVVGAMMALAGRKAKVNAVGVVGLVENMPDGAAQRPGDVVKSMSGQTIEVLNTDAEGRLVLADCLWYAQKRFKPKAMVDFATLTGAIIITLGRGQFAGLFSDDDAIAAKLDAAGKESGDRVWRLPMTPLYDKMINCEIADMKNISGGRDAGSITAAQFLRRFTNNVPWAHVDVAGMVWTLKPGRLWDKGATGYGVRLVDQFVADNYE
jgi:leucyl aminopeptidase